MSVDDFLLFIDSNKYLDLYRTDKGKKLLASLREQKQHIFVTHQVVDEVQRNKLSVTAKCLAQKSGRLTLPALNVPDHLSGTTSARGAEIPEQIGEIDRRVKQVRGDVNHLFLDSVEKVSRSEDEISSLLKPIFARAVAHSAEELQRARDRRELGNPPGKGTNAIGDQLNWEQILTHFEGKKRLWIVSRDGDYGAKFGEKVLLNSFLYTDLCRVSSDPEVYVFEDTVEGILHFVDTVGVKAREQLTSEEVEEIKREEESLPRLDVTTDWLRAAVGAMPTHDEIRRAIGPMPTDEEIRRAIGAMPTHEEIRRAIGAMPTDEEIRRAIGAMPTHEEIRRATGAMVSPRVPVDRVWPEAGHQDDEEAAAAADSSTDKQQHSRDDEEE